MEDLFSGYAVFQRHLDYSKYIDFFIKSPKHRFLMMVLTQLQIYRIAFIVKITQKKIRMKKNILSQRFFQNKCIKIMQKYDHFWGENARRWLWRRKSAGFSSEIRTTFQAICWNFIIAWWYAENELNSVLRTLRMMSETISNLYHQ